MSETVQSGSQQRVVSPRELEARVECTKTSGLVGVGGVPLRQHASFKAAHVEWGTPPDLKDSLDKEFRFTLDPCTPGQAWDGRAISWAGHRVFCNPPYGKGLDKWLVKGPEAELAVYLVPARTDTKWFHDHALLADEIRFFRGRIKFVENHIVPYKGWSGNGAPFPSMLVIFRAGGGGAELGENARGTKSAAQGANV